jgi:hypothetical protein
VCDERSYTNTKLAPNKEVASNHNEFMREVYCGSLIRRFVVAAVSCRSESSPLSLLQFTLVVNHNACSAYKARCFLGYPIRRAPPLPDRVMPPPPYPSSPPALDLDLWPPTVYKLLAQESRKQGVPALVELYFRMLATAFNSTAFVIDELCRATRDQPTRV